jgi:hypothetical protein
MTNKLGMNPIPMAETTFTDSVNLVKKKLFNDFFISRFNLFQKEKDGDLTYVYERSGKHSSTYNLLF